MSNNSKMVQDRAIPISYMIGTVLNDLERTHISRSRLVRHWICK